MFVETADGEERQVAEHELRITEFHSLGPSSHTTDYEIRGASAVTPELANRVQREFQVDVEKHGVDVIDPGAEDVTRL